MNGEDGTISNGSDCGNETASEREMFRRFMVHSVCYWAKEYHIDGFRFDLMALHDTETMNAIRTALNRMRAARRFWFTVNRGKQRQAQCRRDIFRRINRISEG